MDNELLSLLRYELGEVTGWEELCPGVYSLTVQPNPDSVSPCSECYLVLPDAPISQEARALGKPLDDSSGLLYPIDPPREGAWTAVMYELRKNGITHGVSEDSGWTLSDASSLGMELCPAYFGTYPVPPCTPWGWTLRWRALENGVYWLETSQCKHVLAVCYSIWTGELSDGVQKAGTRQPLVAGAEEDLGYLFFDDRTSCVAIFELLEVRGRWLEAGLIRKPELMNAIWEYQPIYAASYNAQEQAGIHDALGILLQMVGADSKPQGSVENMICVTPGKGADFIGFWR